LIENAAHYTPRRGAIRVFFENGEHQFTLAIVNPTDDLTHEDIPNLFERFWRKESARSSGEHSGLGLALARAYARSLGYRLTAELVSKDIVFAMSGPKALSPRLAGGMQEAAP
jgi:signal transduction histidine kinase